MVGLRRLLLASILLAGSLQVTPVMASEKSPLLHAQTACAVCSASIQDVQWPDVVAVECDNEHHHHAILAHTNCIESQKATYACAVKGCKKGFSQVSKQCLEQTKRIVDAEKKFEESKAKIAADAQAKMEHDPRKPKHALFQWYAPYKDEEPCSICSESLTGRQWPDIVTLHCKENQVGHTYHTACVDGLITRNMPCATCRTAISNNSKAIVRMAMTTFGDGKDSSHPWYLQRHASIKAPIQLTSNSSSSYAPHLINAMKYRILRYPSLFVAAALVLHTAYVYSNADYLTVSDAVAGTFDCAFKGGCLGLIAAGLHHAYDWQTTK